MKLRQSWVAFFIFLLASCGGGGGGGGSGGGSPSFSAPAVTFDPGTVALHFYSGDSVAFAVNAAASHSITGAVYVVVTDSKGVVTPDLQLTSNSTYSYTATLYTSPLLAAGHYTGSLSVKVCKDAQCAAQWDGSPVLLPYDFHVDPASGAPSVAVISPSSVEGALYQSPSSGEEFTIRADIQSISHSPSSSGAIYVSAIDDAGVLVGTSDVSSPTSSHTVNFTVRPADTTAPGHYTGNLKLQFCRDSACTIHVPGSPVLVPYDTQVVAGSNLTLLSNWSGASDWATFQGNAAHSGYVPVTLDKNKFGVRWHWDSASQVSDGATIGVPVTGNGHVFFNLAGGSVFALNESDKSVLWHQSLDSTADLNPPATSGNLVFVTTMGGVQSYFWIIDGSNGSISHQTGFNSTWIYNYAPVVSGGAVYFNGAMNLTYAYDGSSGQNIWGANIADTSQSTPAVDASNVYTYNGGVLKVFNKSNGVFAYSIVDPNYVGNHPVDSEDSAPVLGASNSLICLSGSHGSLTGFDLNAQSVKWTVSGSYETTPAVANGVVYALSNTHNRLEARDESDGTLLWSWTPPAAVDTSFGGGNVIVTDNMVLLSTNSNVYAVNLDTSHALAWSYPHAGQLALSVNGVLYISSSVSASHGVLYAINMK